MAAAALTFNQRRVALPPTRHEVCLLEHIYLVSNLTDMATFASQSGDDRIVNVSWMRQAAFSGMCPDIGLKHSPSMYYTLAWFAVCPEKCRIPKGVLYKPQPLRHSESFVVKIIPVSQGP